MNPLVPAALDAVLMSVSVFALMLALGAFISLIRSRAVEGWRLLGWTLVVIVVPLFGPAAWFVLRRRQRSSEPTRY